MKKDLLFLVFFASSTNTQIAIIVVGIILAAIVIVILKKKYNKANSTEPIAEESSRKKPKNDGKAFEVIVGAMLESLNIEGGTVSNKYKIFNDVMLYGENSNKSNIVTVQIDHIVVSKNGVFVIEDKDWNGYLLGQKDEEYFTLNANKAYSVYSPIKQNRLHYETLRHYIGNIFCQSMVVFNRTAIAPKTRNAFEFSFTWCGNIMEMCDFIDNQENRYSEEKINSIISAIEAANILDENIRREHYERFKK